MIINAAPRFLFCFGLEHLGDHRGHRRDARGVQRVALATAGLFAFARPIETLLTRRGPLSWRWLRWAAEPLTATLAASLVSLPILLYHFGRLSLIAPLANVLMLPAVPYAMLFGSVATVAGMLWLPLGQLLALLAWPCLQWLLVVSHWLAKMPGAYTTLPPFGVGWVWGYYALITAGWLWAQRNKNASESLQPALSVVDHRPAG